MLGQELQLEKQSAKVEIKGTLARTQLRQTFSNPTNRTIEGTYLFPLPEGAAVSNFAMTLDGKLLEAEILEGDKAREIYNGIVQKLRDPAILEFADRNVIRARLFPIAPNSKPEVELTYAQTLKPEAGSYRYNLPLKLPVGGSARAADIDVRIESGDGIRAVYSPTHSVEVKRSGDTATVTGEFGPGNTNSNASSTTNKHTDKQTAGRDFVLYYTANKSRVGVNVVTHQEAGEDGYFMLLAAPDPAIGDQEIAAKDIVFVCDTSGSMVGEKIEQARRALQTLLGTLNPNDRFSVVTFSSDVNSFRDTMVSADKTTLDAARKWAGDIKAIGGTNINDALIQALKLLDKDSTRLQQIVFMTDGQPTVGERDIDQILKNIKTANSPASAAQKEAANKARIFVFGVGYDVNTRLLDTLAEENRGASDYVLPEQDIETVVGELASKIAYPVLSNPKLEWSGVKLYDIYPQTLPDLFRGGQSVVFGRFSGGGTGQVTLTGTRGSREERIVGNTNWSSGADNDALPRLWAMRKVGWLIDDSRRHNRPLDGEVKDEIIKLSKRFGIVTPLTAGLITEDERTEPIFRPLNGPRTRENRGGSIGGSVRGMPPMSDSSGLAGSGESRFDQVLPASGRMAVEAAKSTQKMRQANQVQSDADDMRTIAGKSFVLRNGVWTDRTYDAVKSPKPVTVKFASDEYFALARDAEVAKWLSAGARVIVVLRDRIIEIVP
jgi:Ca-activated chloride channel family protein